MGKMEIYGRPGCGTLSRISERARSLGIEVVERDFGRELEHWASGYDGLSKAEIEKGMSLLAVYWSTGKLPVAWIGEKAFNHHETEAILLKLARDRPADGGGRGVDGGPRHPSPGP